MALEARFSGKDGSGKWDDDWMIAELVILPAAETFPVECWYLFLDGDLKFRWYRDTGRSDFGCWAAETIVEAIRLFQGGRPGNLYIINDIGGFDYFAMVTEHAEAPENRDFFFTCAEELKAYKLYLGQE